MKGSSRKGATKYYTIIVPCQYCLHPTHLILNSITMSVTTHLQRILRNGKVLTTLGNCGEGRAHKTGTK
jgi:hypothetical protein